MLDYEKRDTSVELSPEQRSAVRQLLTSHEQVQTLGGYAGTGKSTLIRYLLDELPDWAVCAFTGKATHVLRRKGVPASTIHSLIYRSGADDYKGGIDWQLASRLECRGIIVDEASMVGRPLYNDLCSFGLPIIFVGDHGQLPPVERAGGAEPFNLMARSDITLETIHRNAGEIARFAEFVRQGNRPADWTSYQPKPSDGCQVQITTLDQVFSEGSDQLKTALDYGQIICAFNYTRVAINTKVREGLHRDKDRPVKGDRIMCLQNSHRDGLFNGMQGTVGAVGGGRLTFIPEAGKAVRVCYVAEAFNAVKKPPRDRYSLPFDYCWAVTCHKAQGDEWDRVLVLEQKCAAWEHKRWAYTAASRAKVRLDWVEL